MAPGSVQTVAPGISDSVQSSPSMVRQNGAASLEAVPAAPPPPRPPAAASGPAVAVGGRRVVAEVGAEPALGFLERHALAGVVVDELVASQLADAEVARRRVPEVEAADAGPRPHRERLGQHDAGVPLDVEE